MAGRFSDDHDRLRLSVGGHRAEGLSQLGTRRRTRVFMGRFIIRRTLYAIVTLFILSLTIFTVIRLTGDPVTVMAEPGAPAEDLDRIRAEWGLDRPLPVQYLSFLKNIPSGDLGKSFNYEMPVSTLYFQRLPNSLELAFAATLISFVIGIPAGLISAVRVNTVWDSAGKVIALFGLAVPGFWLGLVMILIFSVWLARLAADQRPGRLATPDHAGGGARLVFRRLALAADALEHARSDGQRIHQAGAAEGPARLRRDRAARLQERADPGTDARRRQSGDHDQRGGDHRGHLRLAGHRPAPVRGHLSARLPARAGGGHGSRDHDRRHQSDDRHPLRLYRPPHPTDQIGARWRYRCKIGARWRLSRNRSARLSPARRRARRIDEGGGCASHANCRCCRWRSSFRSC